VDLGRDGEALDDDSRLGKRREQAPKVGLGEPVEFGCGEVIDLAWAEARVGVTFDGEDTADGWTLCPADVAQIVAALKSNGVM